MIFVEQAKNSNPKKALLCPLIEEVWDVIADEDEDDWQLFEELVQCLQTKN